MDNDLIICIILCGGLFIVMLYFIVKYVLEINAKMDDVHVKMSDIVAMTEMAIESNVGINTNIKELKDINNEMNNRMLLNTQHVIEEQFVKDINIDNLNIDVNRSDETLNNKVSYVDMSPSESLKNNID